MRLRVARPWRRTIPLPGPFYLAPSRRRRSSGFGPAALLVVLVYVGLWFSNITAAVVVTVILAGGVAVEVQSQRKRRR